MCFRIAQESICRKLLLALLCQLYLGCEVRECRPLISSLHQPWTLSAIFGSAGTDKNLGEIVRMEVDKMDADRELQTQLR